jgi:hypothetical protein
MNRYRIERNDSNGFAVEANFDDGDVLHSPHLTTEEEAEEWVDLLMRLKRRPLVRSE